MTLDPYYLSKGEHQYPSAGRCAMEWVAFIAGEEHSDEPVCVSDYLADLCRGLNDYWSDKDRQRLRPYLVRCIGTADDGLDDVRERLAYEVVMTRPYGVCACTGCLAALGPDVILPLLDRMLPTVTIDLPAPVAERAREVCGVIA
jgi:hypothetical protein